MPFPGRAARRACALEWCAALLAAWRASICGAQVVLASATPSLESWANAESGKYKRVTLTSRFGAAQLPEMRALDLRASKLPTGRWIAPQMVDEVNKRLEKGEHDRASMENDVGARGGSGDT